MVYSKQTAVNTYKERRNFLLHLLHLSTHRPAGEKFTHRPAGEKTARVVIGVSSKLSCGYTLAADGINRLGRPSNPEHKVETASWHWTLYPYTGANDKIDKSLFGYVCLVIF